MIGMTVIKVVLRSIRVDHQRVGAALFVAEVGLTSKVEGVFMYAFPSLPNAVPTSSVSASLFEFAIR